ncbi:helix-hairpin-helix domain-containing protein [Streptomyces sp. YIM S03343]
MTTEPDTTRNPGPEGPGGEGAGAAGPSAGPAGTDAGARGGATAKGTGAGGAGAPGADAGGDAGGAGVRAGAVDGGGDDMGVGAVGEADHGEGGRRTPASGYGADTDGRRAREHGTSRTSEGGADQAETGGSERDADADGTDADGIGRSPRPDDRGDPEDGPDGPGGPSGEAERRGDGEEGSGGRQLSEADAELAAQRVERERIARRKAERNGPIESGAKLSGKAADLLAAVRAVEGGAKPAATVFAEPAAPRRPAPEPVRRPQPAPAPAAVPGAGTVDAVGQVLTEGGAPESLAAQAATSLGDGADTVLRDDPWQLLRVAGVRPEQADGFARALLGTECGPDDERRVRAVTGWLLEQAALAGHTALEAPALTAALAKLGVPDPDEALNGVIGDGEVLVFQDALDEPSAAPQSRQARQAADTAGEGEESAEGTEDAAERPVRVLVGLERYALAEESLADGLARLINSVPKEDGPAEGWERAAAGARGSAGELIRAVAGHGLVLHTGGPASVVDPAALVVAARGLGLRAWAAAHTPGGRTDFAAAPVSRPGAPEGAAQATAPVTTVAGLLAGAEGPGRDADGALDLDLLVVLDAPQLDVETAALLVESLPDGVRLVAAGDPGVLWSAGPGRVFADLLAAKVCPLVASRVPDTGPLGELVSGIGAGELQQVAAPGKEVVIVPVRNAGEAVHRTVQLVADSVPRAFGIPAGETVVVTPGHGGAAGTRALNAAVKERLNPGPGRFGGFDPGDLVAYSPAPGRTVRGRVASADAEGLHLEVPGGSVVVARERVEQSVRHGWALTAHQAVGTRWPAAVVVLPGDAAQALSRPWVYTAFSRASRHLSVVHGVEQALPRAVADIPHKPRTTRLPVLLKQQIPTAD